MAPGSLQPIQKTRKKQGIEERPGPSGFVEFQHPRLASTPPVLPGWLHEIKFDGYRMQVHVRNGRATFFSRNGNDWTERFPGLGALAGELEDCVLDAELCALDAEGYSSFSALRSAIFKAPDTLVLFAFDILWRGETDMRSFSLTHRKKVLRRVLEEGGEAIAGAIRYVEEVEGDPRRLLDAVCGLSWEGIVSKRRDSVYRSGERSDAWQKCKCRKSESIVVGGYVTDKSGFSYLLGGVREADGRLRYVGSIKGGFGGDVVLDLKPRLKALASDKSPFDIDSPRKTHDIHWLKPELVAEVEFAEFTASGKLRQSSFKGIREDLGCCAT
jgi:bifunctional non-homologous end joining protein LigD